MPRILTVLSLLLLAPPSLASPRVVASIKPVHSIAANVMDGVGTPQLLLRGAASPHSYALKPSDAKMLADADLVFWIGPDMETFLEQPVANLTHKGARALALSEAPSMALLPAREGGLWGEDHDHDGGADGHVWLDPMNAASMARAMADALGKADPGNAARYAGNAARFSESMAVLDRELAAKFAPVAAVPYIVFHDAYHYAEARYGLSPAGAVTVAPERPYGPRRISDLRARIRRAGTICLFGEPQFPPKLIATLAEGTQARAAVLDPLGADLEPGPALYQTMMRAFADDLTACLTRR